MTIPITSRLRSPAASGPSRGRTPRSLALAAAVAGAAALPPAALAQPSAGDPRWLPWFGCWQLVEETGARPSDDFSAFADRVLVCVTPPAGPAPATDVVVTTLADGEKVLEETLSADGREHAVDQTECRGRRRIAWSDDGARLFTRAELSCSGQNDDRRVSGVGLVADGGNWLNLEQVEAGQRAAVTVRRYRRAGDVSTLSAAGPTLTADLLARARTAAAAAADADLTIEAVIEAGTVLEPAVLEALLVETGAAFDLDGRTLVRLADGGVSGEITDMLVALSFPENFSVRRAEPAGGGGGGFLSSWSGYGYDSWYPYYAAPFGYYYGWSPYRSLYGWGDYYYLDAPYYGAPGSGVGDRSGAGRGRVYSGYGYARTGRPRDGEGRRAQPRNPGVGVAAVAGSDGSSSPPRATGGDSSGAPRATGGSSGSGGGRGVSTRGWSRGGSSSSGRVATPRSGGSSGGSSGRSAAPRSGGSSGGSSGRSATPQDR